jgi:hypothetical protein
MRALRWAAASLLMLLAGLLGLVGAILCVTLVLLPLGIPLLFVARRLFRSAGQLVVPRPVRHPVDETQRRASGSSRKLKKKSRRALGRGPSPSSGVAAAGHAVRSATDLLPGRPSRSTRVRRRLHLT